MGKITVELLGRIKDCRVLTYRQDLISFQHARSVLIPFTFVFYFNLFVLLVIVFLLKIKSYFF